MSIEQWTANVNKTIKTKLMTNKCMKTYPSATECKVSQLNKTKVKLLYNMLNIKN